MLNNLTRRATIIGLGASLAVLPMSAHALTKSEATTLVGKIVADINGIINSGISEKAMYPRFGKILTTYGDMPIIARSVLGVAWRSASASQRTKFTKAFLTYMSIKYGKRFREFAGGKIVVTGAKSAKGGYLVSTMAHLKNQAPFDVDWQVSDKSGKPLMFNLYIEGINMLASERAEVGAMLDKRKGNLDRLIKDLPGAA